MSIFNKPKGGGILDAIRCDEQEYLIWKWHPNKTELNNNQKENSIRWGSSITVREGSVAVFVFEKNGQVHQDYIEGPFIGIVDTDNLPVIASVIGLAYDGGTPFPAEVYFINLAEIIQIKFGIPFFDVFDSRYPDFGVPTAVRGRISFKIADYKDFIKLHRLDNFDIYQFEAQVKDAVSRYVKSCVINANENYNIPVYQLERRMSSINEIVEEDIKSRFRKDFGISVSGVDISAIELDKSSVGYKQLKAITQDVTTATVQAQTAANVKNIADMQRINAENYEKTLQYQREEAQYAIHMNTESQNFETFKVEQQSKVGIAGAEALGNMGVHGGTEVGGGMNPAGLMAGLAMGGAVGQNIAGSMNSMMGSLNQPATNGTTPPPIPTGKNYHIAVNGQPTGPFDVSTIISMIMMGQIACDTLLWNDSLAGWTKANELDDFKDSFNKKDIPPIPTND